MPDATSPTPPSGDPHRGARVLHHGPPLSSARFAMVLVHGRGAGAADILGLAAELHPPSTAYLAPDAAGGSWYPYSFLAPIERNEPWLSSALTLLGRVFDQVEAAGIPRERTALAGFSQGACLATEYLARNPAHHAALLAFTGGLIGPPGHRFEHAGDLAGTPVLLSSGDPDPHVPWRRVEETAEVLRRLGAEVEVHRWPGRPHAILSQELVAARELLARVLPS